jgi:hypothetical protein
VEVDPKSIQDGTYGIIGLGPDVASINSVVLNQTQIGDTPLANIFKQDASAPNIITFTLGRTNIASSNPAEGSLTIGEVLPGYGAISGQPKLPIVKVDNFNSMTALDQHWSVLLDKDGVKVNGKTVRLPKSRVNGNATPNQLIAAMDSGFSFPQVPKYVVAFFSDSTVLSQRQGNHRCHVLQPPWRVIPEPN